MLGLLHSGDDKYIDQKQNHVCGITAEQQCGFLLKKIRIKIWGCNKNLKHCFTLQHKLFSAFYNCLIKKIHTIVFNVA